MFIEDEERERRQKIQAPLIQSDPPDRFEDDGGGEIQIKAQPQNSMDQLKLMLSRNLIEEHSWVFQNPEDAEDSPAARALLELDGICSVQADGSTPTVQTARAWIQADRPTHARVDPGQPPRPHPHGSRTATLLETVTKTALCSLRGSLGDPATRPAIRTGRKGSWTRKRWKSL